MILQTHFHSFSCNNFESSMLRASIASSSFNIHRHRQDTADEALDRNQSKSCSYLVVSHHMCIGSLIWQNDPWRNILCKTKHFTQTILFLWISTSHKFCSSASASFYSCAVYHGFNLMSVLKNREMTTWDTRTEAPSAQLYVSVSGPGTNAMVMKRNMILFECLHQNHNNNNYNYALYKLFTVVGCQSQGAGYQCHCHRAME